jgi:hypothetical protein
VNVNLLDDGIGDTFGWLGMKSDAKTCLRTSKFAQN